MPDKTNISLKSWMLGLLGCVSVLALWQIASIMAGEYFLPSPLAVLEELTVQIGNPEFFRTIMISYQRILSGWFLGCALGIIIGIMMGRYKPVNVLFYSPIQFFRVIPTVALVPALVFWLGVGELIKTIIISYGVALVVALAISESVQHVPSARLRAAQSMGAGGIRIFWEVLLPSVVPEILKAVRTAFAFAFMSIVGVEMFAAQDGVGRMIWGARTTHNLSLALLGIISLGVMGIVGDTAIKTLFRLSFRRF